MATTTNYGWTTPNDTDLVKDGAAAIRTLGSSIDTTTKNLNPQTTTGALAYRSATANVNTALPIGTAGQVLRVNSGGTAPEWATSADQTPLTTKGDLFGFDTADARIPIGTNGHILTADSTQSLGLKWAAPSGGALTWSLLNSGGTALSGSAKTTISFSAQKQLLILYKDASSANASSFFNIRLNDDSAAAYTSGGTQGRIYDPINANLVFAPSFLEGLTEIRGARMSTSSGSLMYGSVKVENADSTSYKIFTALGGGTRDSSDNPEVINQQGFYSGASAITSVSFNSSTGNFDGGTVYVYGGV